MGKTLKILLCLCLLLPSCLPAQDEDTLVLASPDTAPEKGHGPFMLPLERQLRTTWFTALSLVKTGQLAAAKGDLQKMIQGAQRLNLQSLTPFALSIIIQGRDALAGGDSLRAQWFAEMAVLLDPQLPEARLFTAELAWSKKDFMAVPPALAGYYHCLLQNEPYRDVFQTNILLYASIEILILFLFLNCFLLYAGLPKIFHDTRELFSRRYGGASVLILSLSVLGLPVVLGLNWFWLAAWVMILTWGYATERQRAVALGLAALTALIAPVLSASQNRLIAGHSPVLRAAEALQAHQVSYPYIGDLEMLHSTLGNDPGLLFVIGTVYQTNDDASDALEAYRLALESGGNQPYVHLNLGNLYYTQNNSAAAIPEYLKAQAQAPDFIPAYYNLFKAYNASYEYQKGQDILRAGLAVNERSMSRYLAGSKDVTVVNALLSIAEARDLADRITRSGALRGKGIRGHGEMIQPLEGWTNPLTLAALLGMAGAVTLHLIRRRRGYAGVCVKCGRTFCPRCKSASESQIYCTQCIHIYIKKDGVPFEIQARKALEVRVHQARTLYLRKLMSALFPGFSTLQHDRTVQGILLYLLFSWLMVLGIHPALLPLLHIRAPVLDELSILALIFGAVVWILVNARVLLEKEGH